MFRKFFGRTVILLGSSAAAVGYLGASGNEWFYKNVAMQCVRQMDAENAHVFAVKCASKGFVPRGKDRPSDIPLMKTDVFGIEFANPIGLAAGFDKNAECYNGMLKLGFGFVEVGSVTPKPQEGNPKPRVFRLLEDKAVINRYGFNSHGIEACKERLNARGNLKETGIVGVNLGKNKNTEDAIDDYVKGIKELGHFADYIVINVSSPNTPGLRKMQGKEQLESLILKALDARNQLKHKPPLLVKIAPDLTDDDKVDISDVITSEKTKVDGLIVTNTTIARPLSLKSASRDQVGGLSGEPLKEMSTKVVGDMYKLTEGRLPIIGVGGISSGRDAYDKIRAGASLVQLYTVLTYEGPTVISKIKRDLADLLRDDGFKSVAEAVGASHR
ncbi:dihydroorotate dehydrogenase (quinone), mitochondrial-like [Rhopilema esculentum]|uniref:dihydroorotate dehydrogenase (quinone), mitochondrial-like n=1 Tax=Rhopilema esculentum TaxID=499914 RepID=UPI0031D58503|eukprot:gene1449-15874_t